MTIKVFNTSRYIGENVTRLVRAGLRGNPRRKLTNNPDKRPIRAYVVDARGEVVHIAVTGSRSFRLTLPKPSLNPPYLAQGEAARAIRAVCWAALIISGCNNADLTVEQKTLSSDQPSWIEPYELEVRERSRPDPRRPEAKQEAHAKKLKHAEKMLLKAARRAKLAHTLQTKWQRKLNALKAASDRVGLPVGKREKTPITQDLLDAIDTTFAEATKDI